MHHQRREVPHGKTATEFPGGVEAGSGRPAPTESEAGPAGGAGVGHWADDLESVEPASRSDAAGHQGLRGHGGGQGPAPRSRTVAAGARHSTKRGGLLRQRVILRYRFIEVEKAAYPVEVLCRVLHVTHEMRE